MKTIREWLNELPEPYRSRAIENAENGHDNLNALVDSLEDAIMRAFMWTNTPEGLEYWGEVFDGETPELPEHLNKNR